MNLLLALLVTWTVAGNTQDETDVRTDGRLLYAYAPRETTVNGVCFVAVPNGNDFPKDISFAVPVNSIPGAYWHDDKSLWKGGDAYKALLSNAFYSSRLQNVQLHGLVPGRKYLVQIWFCDMRGPRRHACQFVGDKTLSMSDGGNYFGSNAVGTFIASGTEQRFGLASNVESQINAIQVRDLDDDEREAPATVLKSGIAESFLSRFNPTWTSGDLGVTYTSAMPTAALLGNGTLGVVNGETADGKCFVLTRGDLWSCGAFEAGGGSRPDRDVLPISFADFLIEPGEGEIAYSDTLDVATATLETRGTFGGNGVLLRSFVAASEDTFVVSGVTTRDACWKLRLRTHDGFDCFPSEAFILDDGVGVRRRTINAVGSRGWETNATAVVKAVGADIFRVQALSVHEAVADVRVYAGQRFAFVLLSGNRSVDAAVLENLRRLHDAWWEEWFGRSRIHLNDDAIEGFYYGALYLLGSGVRSGKFPPGIYGPWVTTDTPNYQNDYHLNYNYIATYYGCYVANRPEIADTLPDPLLAYLPKAEFNARNELGRLDEAVRNEEVCHYVRDRKDLANGIFDAALFPVTIGPWGTAPAGDTMFWRQTLNGSFSAAAVCTYWEYTLDRNYLRKVWPLLDKVANFYLSWCEKESAGDGGYRYVLWDAWAEDQALLKNSAQTLGPVRYLFETLVSVEPILKELGIDVPAEKAARWRDFATHLSELPTGLTKIGDRDVEVLSMVETDNGRAKFWYAGGFELESVFPGEAFAFDAPERLKTAATNTVLAKISSSDGNTWESINQTTKLYAMAIRAGYPAAPIIEAFKKWEIERRNVKNFTLNDHHHGIEKVGAIEFVNSMLLQSDHGFVKVFPNWIGTDASFERLRAKGAFVVSAEMRRGKVRRVTVTSEKGGVFRLVDPFGGKMTPVDGLTRGQTRFSREATLELEMRPGETRELTALAAGVTWTLQANTSSDSDVRTEGRCLYAYTPSLEEVCVNGVQFGRYTEATAQFADDASLDVAMNRHSVWMSGKEDEWKEMGGSDEYLKLLKSGWYKGAPFPTRLTLTGLTAGKRYLVQIWLCDARLPAKTYKTLTIGGLSGNCCGDGFGMNFVGTFTAEETAQEIELAYAHEANLNAFQVRCLDDARIEWTGTLMSGESDVRTDGGLLYAYKAGSDLTVARTRFEGVDDSAVSEYGSDITFNKPFPSQHLDFCTGDASVPDGAYSYSENYRKLIEGAHHLSYPDSKFLRRNVTLHYLRPGCRYLVQHWVVDNRSAAAASGTVVVDWSTVLAYNDGRVHGHGSMAVGAFTAVSTEQTFECYYRVSGDDMSGSSSAHVGLFGPIQVRRLDDREVVEGWMVGNTEADGSVDTRGQPLYALSGVQTTVSGTPFAGFGGTAESGYGVSGDFGDVVMRKLDGSIQDQTKHAGNAFILQSTVQVSPSVTNLLGNGIYRNGSPDKQLVELRNLQPGRRYLVQAWFTDTRRDMSGKFGGRSMQYRILTNNEAPLGQYVTGVFRATSDTYSVLFEMASPQLNAIQVRALDTPIDGVIRWTNEPTKAGSASVSTEGALKYAYAPYAFTTDSGVAFAEGAAGATVLGGGNVVLEHAFENRNKVFAPDETSDLFKNAWYNLPAGNAANAVTLGNLKPTYEYLVQVFVADLRNSAVGLRTLAIQGNTGRFGPYNSDGVCPYGSVFTGRFTADATTKSFVLNYKSAAEAQLNAIQVREVGPTLAVRVPNSGDSWTTDGAGWAVGGVEQTGKTLWDAANGAANSAYVDGNASIALGSDVTIASLYGSGELTLGADDTAYALDVKDDISAPLATVKAVWKNPCVRKTYPGAIVLEGACPALRIVDVYAGRVVLCGAVSEPLELTVVSPGSLGFAENRMLPVSSLAGDGVLAGPGGILLNDGRAFAVPASLVCVDGFTWGLANGSTLVLPANYDASQLRISIDDPGSRLGRLVVAGDETVTGKPEFVYGKKDYYVIRDATGWRMQGEGLMVILR